MYQRHYPSYEYFHVDQEYVDVFSKLVEPSNDSSAVFFIFYCWVKFSSLFSIQHHSVSVSLRFLECFSSVLPHGKPSLSELLSAVACKHFACGGKQNLASEIDTRRLQKAWSIRQLWTPQAEQRTRTRGRCLTRKGGAGWMYERYAAWAVEVVQAEELPSSFPSHLPLTALS